MPGIAGIIGPGASHEQEMLVRTMLGAMHHDPTYTSGSYSDSKLGVYAGWVAHPNSFAERQASAGEPGPQILFAGECFGTDTVGERKPVSTYERVGERFLEELDGSFSGLLVDPNRGRALLFTDRFGSERVYYHERGNTLYFASEAKSLLRVLPELKQFDDEGVVQFFTYGTALPERTLFRGIRVMDPGSIWTFEGGRPLAKHRYFRPETWAELPQLGVAEYRERLSAACREAVRARFESDSRIGISITGGLDTRMIMACLPSARHAPLCYTFAGIEGETLDVRLGRQVAQECGLEHRTLRVGPDFLRRYGELVDRTVFVTDGYAGALGAHEIYLNALAKEVAPVRVTGNFGSEILRGMSSKPSALASDLLAPEWRDRVAACGQHRASLRNMNPVVFAVFHEIASIHFGVPAAAKSQLTLRTPFVSNQIVELAIRAPASERLSPAACASLIAQHHPALAAIPTDRGVTPSTGKSSVARHLFTTLTFKLDYLHKEGLPPALRKLESALQATDAFGLLGLHKYLPYRTWLKNELADHVRDVLSDSSVRQMPWWNTTALDRVLADHRAGRRNNLREINAILTLASVYGTLIRSSFVTHDETGLKGT